MIKESVVWIEQTREQAITLANDIGYDAEVHALVIRKSTFEMAHKPVGYLVYCPPKWVGLTDEEILKFQDIVPNTLGYDLIEFAKAVEAKLKEKNHV